MDRGAGGSRLVLDRGGGASRLDLGGGGGVSRLVLGRGGGASRLVLGRGGPFHRLWNVTFGEDVRQGICGSNQLPLHQFVFPASNHWQR